MRAMAEFDFDAPAGQKTVATVNPGLSYVAVTWQAAGEDIIPLNQEADAVWASELSYYSSSMTSRLHCSENPCSRRNLS